MAGPCCRIFWGSHGCDRPLDHEGIHRCGTDDPCSEFEATGDVVKEDFVRVVGRVRYSYDDAGTDWSDWLGSEGFYMGPWGT